MEGGQERHGRHTEGRSSSSHPAGGAGSALLFGGPAAGSGHPVLLRIPKSPPNFILKIKKYFMSTAKSGGDETCEVREIGPGEYLLSFQNQEAQSRVLEKKPHVIEGIQAEAMIAEDMSNKVHCGHRPSETHETADRYGEGRRGNDYRDPDRSDPPGGDDESGPRPAHFTANDPSRAADSHRSPEIFSELSATLNTDYIDGETLREIKRRFTSVKVIESDSGVKITGSFRAIEDLHDFLEKKHGGAVSRSVHEEQHKEEDMEDSLHFNTALYEYIADIYKEELMKIESRFNVKLTEVKRSKDTAYIKVKPSRPNSSVERAREMFINQVQDVAKDWRQKEVPISAMKSPLENTKQYMKTHHKTLVVEDGDRLILRGPERELTLAVEALQKGSEGRSLLPQRVINISKEMRREVLVDARHMDFLKKLKSREIEALQKKYSVRMDEEGKDRSVIVAFRAMNGAFDLGAHACHHFTSFLQSTIMNLQRRTIKFNMPEGTERLAEFSARLTKDGIDVILEHDQDSITIIASPILVDFAEEKLQEFFKMQGARGAAASGEVTDEEMDTSHPPDNKASAEEKCPICLDQMKNKKALPKCKHEFCDVCLQKSTAIKPVCPVCSVPFGVVIGNQPDGTMHDRSSRYDLPGFPGCGTIEIQYSIHGGIQQEKHPHPGKPFYGTQRIAYLPDNQEGREVLRLLRKAFDQKLIFTIGQSRTTGCEDTVTWNDIHHKTSTYGGPSRFGYPDPDYLKRVRDELKAKGIE